MKIYIASSWKNQHGVELLTAKLRNHGFEVISWIENNYDENPDSAFNSGKFDFEIWVNSKKSEQSFHYDTQGAMSCDAFIYYGPAGKDAAAECGICYGHRGRSGKHVPMVGLAAKGEDFGLMRKMFDEWFTRFGEVIDYLIWYRETVETLKPLLDD